MRKISLILISIFVLVISGCGGFKAGKGLKASEKNKQGIAKFKNSIGMEFVGIEAGTFLMGSKKGNIYEKPVHRVTISKPFFISV